MISDQPMTEQNHDHRVAQVMDELRRRGRRLTPQRAAIIRAFMSRTDHPSAERLYQELHPEYPMIALSTVYDTLRLLVELREAVEVSAACAQARFDTNVGDHGHLVCTHCGDITDFPLGADVCREDVSGCVRDAGFEPERHVYQVFGVCARCRKGV